MNYVDRKYQEFYEKYGYIPKMFNPYNCNEITDIAPTLTANCGGTSSSSSSILICEEGYDLY